MVQPTNSPTLPHTSPAASSTPYTDAFYLGQRDISFRSAECVVPLVISLVNPKSVIDVGCGAGTWAAKFLDCGITDVVGIDGDYVNRDLLIMPREKFSAYDLTQTIDLGRRFDLAVCMEVAEHLPSGRADGLVRDLTSLAPAILFSAAIPGQGGTDHINEQFMSYWVKHFANYNYVMLDIIRPSIWNEDGIDWVYRQNAALYVRRDQPLAQTHSASSGVDYIHPFLYNKLREQFEQPVLGYLLRSIPGSLSRSLRKRLGRLFK